MQRPSSCLSKENEMKLYCSIGTSFSRGATYSSIVSGVDDDTLLKLLVGARFCTLGYDAEEMEFESVEEIRKLLSTHTIEIHIRTDYVLVDFEYHVPDKINGVDSCYQCKEMKPLRVHSGRWRCDTCIKDKDTSHMREEGEII